MKLGNMQYKHIKPYLFILGIFIVPMVMTPVIKNIRNNFFSDSNTEKISEYLTDTARVYANFALAIHGGAGNIIQGTFTPEQEAKYKSKLYEALQVGMAKLYSGDSAVYVVIEVIKILEDSPLFNAGKGSVYTNDRTHELDASIMDGRNLNAGGVAGITNVKNPIIAAYEVMVNSKHVLLSGKGAEQFAKKQQLELVKPTYFDTDKQWNNLQKVKHKEKEELQKMGTVGCVVLDKYGNLAAGTSTGGMTNKMYGRIGDSPIIGAGTYADNSTCAVSATGHGEYFIRYNVCYDIAARIKYLHESIKQSSDNVITSLKAKGGNGGVICIDTNGNINMPYNTPGMFRGYCKLGEEPQILLY